MVRVHVGRRNKISSSGEIGLYAPALEAGVARHTGSSPVLSTLLKWRSLLGTRASFLNVVANSKPGDGSCLGRNQRTELSGDLRTRRYYTPTPFFI